MANDYYLQNCHNCSCSSRKMQCFTQHHGGEIVILVSLLLTKEAVSRKATSLAWSQAWQLFSIRVAALWLRQCLTQEQDTVSPFCISECNTDTRNSRKSESSVFIFFPAVCCDIRSHRCCKDLRSGLSHFSSRLNGDGDYCAPAVIGTDCSCHTGCHTDIVYGRFCRYTCYGTSKIVAASDIVVVTLIVTAISFGVP